jgi:hypothetical protein
VDTCKLLVVALIELHHLVTEVVPHLVVLRKTIIEQDKIIEIKVEVVEHLP